MLLSYSGFIFVSENSDDQFLDTVNAGSFCTTKLSSLDPDDSSYLEPLNENVASKLSSDGNQSGFVELGNIMLKSSRIICLADEFYKKKKDLVEKEFPELKPYFNENVNNF